MKSTNKLMCTSIAVAIAALLAPAGMAQQHPEKAATTMRSAMA